MDIILSDDNWHQVVLMTALPYGKYRLSFTPDDDCSMTAFIEHNDLSRKPVTRVGASGHTNISYYYDVFDELGGDLIIRMKKRCDEPMVIHNITVTAEGE